MKLTPILAAALAGAGLLTIGVRADAPIKAEPSLIKAQLTPTVDTMPRAFFSFGYVSGVPGTYFTGGDGKPLIVQPDKPFLVTQGPKVTMVGVKPGH